MKHKISAAQAIRNSDSDFIAKQTCLEVSGIILTHKYDYISSCPFLVITLKTKTDKEFEVWCSAVLERQLSAPIRKKGNKVRISGFVSKELDEKFIGVNIHI